MALRKKVVKTYGKRAQRTLLYDNWLSPELKESSTNLAKPSNAFSDLNDSTFCEETLKLKGTDKQLEKKLCNLLWSNLEVTSPGESPVLVPETPEAELKTTFCRRKKKAAAKNASLSSDEPVQPKNSSSTPDIETVEKRSFQDVFVNGKNVTPSNNKENKAKRKKTKAGSKPDKLKSFDGIIKSEKFEQLEKNSFTLDSEESIVRPTTPHLQDLSREENSLLYIPCEVKLPRLVSDKKIQFQGTPDTSNLRVQPLRDAKTNIIHENDVENNESVMIESYIPDQLSPIVKPDDLHDQFLVERSFGNFRNSLTPFRGKRGTVLTARKKVLLHCGQSEVIPFTSVLTEMDLEDCRKIGEGVYGEVFQMKLNDENVAVKIIPIEGDLVVNDEPQKTFEEILPEIVISKELSSLRGTNIHGQTNHFIEVKAVHCCQGKFPPDLIRLWDEFDSLKGSDNDRPDSYCDQQLFIMIVFANGGCDLESFKFDNVLQMKSVLQQTIGALAVAEATLQFEHRDLHWGNILVNKHEGREDQQIVLGNEMVEVDGCGLHVSIIDFTLSRLHKDGCTLFYDLSMDESLFQGEGDYQFDMYRLMRTQNKNEWDSFNAYTNVLWTHYLTRKLLEQKKIKKSRKKVHQQTFRQLKAFEREVLNFKSAQEIIKLSKLFTT
ncbi:serine/threonine-protein kinase haspin-like [Anneissia japonica]|uniref:serine/threonine-protein kinase haspin-like n=1 Tax=Anneissia japonica TaxID=1529436 RepID=UPI0014258E4E|nr:serine/threonine-protein kinase haspin-like [Anneissia japonica]